jgi:hypothetical protein
MSHLKKVPRLYVDHEFYAYEYGSKAVFRVRIPSWKFSVFMNKPRHIGQEILVPTQCTSWPMSDIAADKRVHSVKI